MSSKRDREVEVLQRKIAELESLLDSFWTGDVPENASLSHMILAKAGRHRLAERSKTPALLVKQTTN